MKWILSILLLLISSSVLGQGFTYSYVDPCSKKLKVIQIPNANSTVTVNYLGYVSTFTKDDFDNGSFAGWVNGLSAKFASAPCDEIKTKTQVAQNTIITQNIISTLSSVTSVSTMTVASSVGSMTSGGLSNSVDNSSSSGENSGNNSGKNSDKKEENKTQSGTNGENQPSVSNPPSQGNTPSGTNTPQTGGNNTQSGTNTAQPNQTSGSNTDKNEPNTNGGGATNSGSNSGSNGGNSGSNSGNSGNNSGNSGNNGGNSGGSGGNGGNIDSKPKTQDPTTTPTDSKSGGNGGTTNSVSNAAESSSTDGGGSGKGGSKTTTAKTGSVIGTGDVVVIRSNEDNSNQFKATMSVTKSNTDNSKTKGALLNFTTTINNSNLTFYAAFANKKRTNTTIMANSSMVDFDRNFFNTTTALESHRWGRFSGMLGANYTLGTLDGSMFSNLSAVGGGFYLFKPSPKITGTILMLGVYSPFTKFYEGRWWKSGVLLVPFSSWDYGISKNFKFNISFSGTYQYNDKFLNYQILTGGKIAL